MAGPQIQGMETEYKPWGGLAGWMTGEREALQRQANLQGLEESQLGNLIKQVEAQRAQSDFARPGQEEARQLGLRGQYDQQQAAGSKAMGTLQSDIGAGKAKNAAAQSGSEIENNLNQVNGALAMYEANGPAGLALASENLSPDLRKVKELTGENFPVVLKKLSDMLKEQLKDSPTHRAKLAEQTQQGTITERIHTADNKSRAQISAADNANRLAIENAGITAGKYNRSSGRGGSFAIQLGKLKVPERLGVVEKALTTGVDPETGEPMTDVARLGYEAMKAQDIRTRDADNSARNVGKLDLSGQTDIPKATTPSVGKQTEEKKSTPSAKSY